MKYLATISLLLLFCGCSSKAVYLKGKDQKDTISYAWGGEMPTAQQFYIVNLEELKKARKPLLYQGTYEGYHLFESISEEPPRKDEILKIAIRHNRLCIRTALSPLEEKRRAKTKGARSLTSEGGIFIYGSSEKIAKRNLPN